MREAGALRSRASLALALAAVAAVAAPGAARADGSAGALPEQVEPARGAARTLVGLLGPDDVVPHRGLFVTGMLGYHGDVAGFAELRLGYGRGRHQRRLLFPTTRVWRVSAAVRGAYGRDDSVAVSLLGGWSKVSLFGLVLEGGVDARLDPGDRAVGPIVSAALRLDGLGLHATTWAHVTDATAWGFTIGLGWTFGDHRNTVDSAADRARQRARDEAGARGVPLP